MSYCLLDAARMEEALYQAQELAGEQHYLCLYKGMSEERLSNVAPYLFESQSPAFVDWLFAEGWGHCWGVYALSKQTPAVVFQHFRRFLLIKTATGQQLYFRFYDPRVLRQFLPTCAASQLIDFFGPVRYFLVEDEDPDYSISYWQEAGVLKTKRLPRQEAQRAYTNYITRQETK